MCILDINPVLGAWLSTHFLPFCELPFCSVDSLLWCTHLKILMQPGFSFFSFVVCDFSVCDKSLPDPMHKAFTFMFFYTALFTGMFVSLNRTTSLHIWWKPHFKFLWPQGSPLPKVTPLFQRQAPGLWSSPGQASVLPVQCASVVWVFKRFLYKRSIPRHKLICKRTRTFIPLQSECLHLLRKIWYRAWNLWP